MGGPVTEREPMPAGDLLTAYRRVLQRARTSEAKARDLRAELAALRGTRERGEQQ